MNSIAEKINRLEVFFAAKKNVTAPAPQQAENHENLDVIKPAKKSWSAGQKAKLVKRSNLEPPLKTSKLTNSSFQLSKVRMQENRKQTKVIPTTQNPYAQTQEPGQIPFVVKYKLTDPDGYTLLSKLTAEKLMPLLAAANLKAKPLVETLAKISENSQFT